jgi:RNA polymerase sigma-70 factor (ECF subfamily)
MTHALSNFAVGTLCDGFALQQRFALKYASGDPAARDGSMTDAQQFEAFVRDYQNMVFSTAMRLLANQSDAEDVTQEVFLRAYERYGDLRNSATLGGWLKTVATNLSLNHLTRYRSRWSFFSEMIRQGEDNEEHEAEFAAADNTDDALAQSERRELVEQALQKLSPKERVPLVLYHFEGLRYEEIAEKLGVSLGKVKTDIFRAREVLRRKLRLKLAEEPR